MKMILGLFFLPFVVSGIVLHHRQIDKVVELLRGLKTEVTTDRDAEKTSYGKFESWCTATMTQKTSDIQTAMAAVETDQTEVNSLSGSLGSHSVGIPQLKKEIAENEQSQADASQLRRNEVAAFKKDKYEYESSITALKAAIQVLKNTGQAKSSNGFLETYQQAQLYSIVAGVRAAVASPEARLSTDDLRSIQEFVAKPENFVRKGDEKSVFALQTLNKAPFGAAIHLGDYAPQSSQIQGILKTMNDNFATDLAAAVDEEAAKLTAYDALMVAKKTDLVALKASLKTQKLDEATKRMTLAEKKRSIDTTKSQVAYDKTVLADATDKCREKAHEWNRRSRLQTQEIAAIDQAITILTDPQAAQTLKAAQKSFLQFGSVNVHKRQNKAYLAIQKIASFQRSLKLARLAVQVRSTGHFDQVIGTIDQMIVDLRQEGKEDIAHRDRCQGEKQDNSNEIGDIDHKIKKTTLSITSLEKERDGLTVKISGLLTKQSATQLMVSDLKTLREGEYNAFKTELKHDQEAIPIIEDAIRVLSQFYRDNQIPLDLLQKAQPETNFQGAYEGGSARSVVKMMQLVKTDLEKEIQVSLKENTMAQDLFIKTRNSLQKSLEEQVAAIDLAKGEKSALQVRIAKMEGDKTQANQDLQAADASKIAIEKGCAWVGTHFEKRRTARQVEIAGLQDARGYLAGMDSGDAV